MNSLIPESSYPNYVIAPMGQSNALGTNGLPPSPLLLPGAREQHIAWNYYYDGVWAMVQDPIGGGPSLDPVFYNAQAGASIVPGLARRLMPTLGNMAFVPASKPASAIWSWLYTPPGGLSYLDRAVARVNSSGLAPNLVTWWQGETDSRADYNTTEAQYHDGLAVLAARFFAEWGCPLMLTVIQSLDLAVYPNQGMIQQAQREAPGVVPHVVAGPDLSDIACAPENTVHLAHPVKIDLAAARMAEAVLAWWTAQ